MSWCKARFLLPPLVFLALCSNFGTITAIRGDLNAGGYPSPKLSPSSGPSLKRIASQFSVLSFGAKGNGHTDDTKAFQAAWTSACKLERSTVMVPSGHKFLVGPISFQGPCKPDIVFQLDGTIIAPTTPKAWGSGKSQWLDFTNLAKGIQIQGDGVIDGQGSAWWSKSQINSQLRLNMPHNRPAALRIYGSYNVIVSGITIQNSPQFHLTFDSCEGVHVFNTTTSSPADSPNTDGIHIHNSVGVLIENSHFSCGDDCISIQTGSSNVQIQNVNCGPGHGISIGGLGKDNTKACVSNVLVQDCTISNTLTGLRIKTWQGGSGSVQNIKFSNIQLSNVKTAIDIDQFYCDASRCKNQSSAVAISDVSYQSIKGTYTVEPVYLACSDSTPCVDISFADIDLQAQEENSNPFCWEAYGNLESPIIPAIDCLKSQKQIKNQNRPSDEYACK